MFGWFFLFTVFGVGALLMALGRIYDELRRHHIEVEEALDKAHPEPYEDYVPPWDDPRPGMETTEFARPYPHQPKC